MLAANRLRCFRLVRIRTIIEDSEFGAQEIATHLAEVATAVLAYLVLVHGDHVVGRGVTCTLFTCQQELVRR